MLVIFGVIVILLNKPEVFLNFPYLPYKMLIVFLILSVIDIFRLGK